ncbi:bifunctional 4-hydroxy-2-oxoglutarate aldolase/2-dehydro-3-deoxy-phosphogluconate aldolase [soil metagenome]
MSATTLERIESARIVPVVVLDDAARAVDLARALSAGGIGTAEITLRTDAGLDAIAAIAADLPDFVIGAGTVLTIDDVDRVIDAGARFVVSPGFDDEVVARTLARGALPLPGVATATEVQRALAAGLGHMKFFPAAQLGGLPTISALAGPFPNARFLPSGGVSLANAGEYLASPSVFAVSGSWMVPRAAIASGDFEMVQRLSAEAVAALPESGTGAST